MWSTLTTLDSLQKQEKAEQFSRQRAARSEQRRCCTVRVAYSAWLHRWSTHEYSSFLVSYSSQAYSSPAFLPPSWVARHTGEKDVARWKGAKKPNWLIVNKCCYLDDGSSIALVMLYCIATNSYQNIFDRYLEGSPFWHWFVLMFPKLHFPYWAGGPIFTLMARKYKKKKIQFHT